MGSNLGTAQIYCLYFYYCYSAVLPLKYLKNAKKEIKIRLLSSSPLVFVMARFDVEAMSGCRAGVHANFEDSTKLENLLSPSKGERLCRGLWVTWFPRFLYLVFQPPAGGLEAYGLIPIQTILEFYDLILANRRAGQSAAIWGSLKAGLCPWGSPGSVPGGGNQEVREQPQEKDQRVLTDGVWVGLEPHSKTNVVQWSYCNSELSELKAHFQWGEGTVTTEGSTKGNLRST